MGSYIVRMKVLPTGPEILPAQLLGSVKASLKENMVFRSSREEQIAFGLYALYVDVATPDTEGMIDKVEEAVAGAKDVAQSELQVVSRLSSQLKNV